MEDNNRIVATNTELREAIKKVYTPEFQTKLIKYSIFRIHTKFGIKYDLSRGFRGIMIEDIISDLMLSFIKNDGGRNWYKSEFPKFEDQIYSALDSQISNTIGKELDKTAKSNANINNYQIESENDNEYEELLDFSLNYLKEQGASDEELLLFEPYVIHKMKRADIAKENGISEQEATNIKKRIERKIPLLREKIKNLSYEKRINK